VNWSKAQLVVSIAQALEDTGDITQVEGVVGLVWSGLERSVEDIIVHSKGHLAEIIKTILNLVREVVHESTDNREEDCVNRLILKIGVGHDVEVTLKSWCDN